MTSLTREAIMTFRRNWRALDTNGKIDFVVRHLGLGLMASAVLIQFGATGLVFLTGALLWYLGSI